VGGLAVEFDASRESGVRALIDEANEANGPIDIFLSNAGVPQRHGRPGGA
jgi:NAD(P)-dependent dehydrogenase (short-subunit alcohol dehydrogenase family)